MKRKLAVIAGTFNPLTNAHLALGKTAKEQLGEECQVLYIPAKSGFLKSWKHMADDEIIADEIRCRMLEETVSDEGFLCDRCEVEGIVSGKTYDTLRYLSGKHGVEAKDVYFVCGTDKLPELSQWYCSEAMLYEFRFLIVQRNHDNGDQMIEDDLFLRQYRESFVLISGEDEFQDISATEVRRAMQAGRLDRIRGHVPPNIYRTLERMVTYD